MHFHELPRELVCLVFENLTTLEARLKAQCVCKYWKLLLQYVAYNYPVLLEIIPKDQIPRSLGSSYILHYNDATSFLRNNYNCRRLSLKIQNTGLEFPVSIGCIFIIAEKWKKLHHLEIEFADLYTLVGLDRAAEENPAFGEKIKRIHINGGIPIYSSLSMFLDFTNLKSLNIIQPLKFLDAKRLIEKWLPSMLESLQIQCIVSPMKQIDHRSCIELSKNLPNLSKLCLDRLTCSDISHIAKAYLGQLEVLCLPRVSNWDKCELANLKFLKNMQKFYISNVPSDDILETLSTQVLPYWPKLKCLFVVGEPTANVCSIVSSLPQNCPQLEALQLYGAELTSDIVVLLKELKNLKSLCIPLSVDDKFSEEKLVYELNSLEYLHIYKDIDVDEDKDIIFHLRREENGLVLVLRTFEFIPEKLKYFTNIFENNVNKCYHCR